MKAHESGNNTSKTQLKREAIAAQELGKELVKLSDRELKRIPLTDAILDAIQHAKKITRNSALRRQMQFIGKIMRDTDATQIQDALSELQQQRHRAKQNLHTIERLRDTLIADGDNAIEEVIVTYPNADRQQLRQLVRNARKEIALQKPPKSARQLFRYLRDLGR